MKIIIFTLLVIVSFSVTANSDITDQCENFYIDLIQGSKKGLPLDQKINELITIKDKCTGTGMYEFRLGTLYTISKNYTEAEKILKKGLSFDSQYKKFLMLGIADIELAQFNFEKSKNLYKSIIDEYSDWYLPFQKLCVVSIEQQKYKDAVSYCDEANKRQEHYMTYGELTVAYHQLGQHNQAVDSVNKAFEMNQNIVADQGVILSAAMSFAHVGKITVAKNILAMHIQVNPASKSNKMYIQAQKFISTKE